MTTPMTVEDRFPVPASVHDDVDIADFTIKDKRAKFKIDSDIFEATTIMSIPMMQQMMKAARGIGDITKADNDTADTVNSQLEAIYSIFDKILIPASAKRFRERLEADPASEDALDARRQVIPVLYFLLEKYGLRPTQPSSDSSSGSPAETDGTTSTAGSSTAGSTLGI